MRNILWVALTVVALTGCLKAPPSPTTEVVAAAVSSLPATPEDAAWQTAPEYAAKLLLQDIVEPRLLKASIAEVRIRALHSGTEAAFRLEWADATEDNLAVDSRFCDACAIQLPDKAEATVPAPQMGEPGRPVEIAYWNAGYQTVVDGRGDSLRDIFPNAQIDHYPFEAASLPQGSDAQREMALRYAPARAVGNDVAGPRSVPVQDLIADGPGTLKPAKTSTSKGTGKRTATGWAVVITRRLPEGARSNIAFAVWQGAEQEVGARKMRTGWIPLVISVKP